MTIVDLIGQLPVHTNKRYSTRTLDQIRWIAVHHTAGPMTQLPEAIARFHVQSNDWPGIGYHALIDYQGTVFKCWPASTVSYCVKKANTPSLCMALIGDFSVHAPPSLQWWAAIELAQAWRKAYASIANVYGHREVPSNPPQATSCPGKAFRMDLFRKDLEDLSETWGESNGQP